jgi:iron(III) transport system substrate-binding protein
MPITRRSAAGLCLSLLLTGAAAAPAFANGEVNVYTYRQPALINPLFEAFTAKTGIEVRVVFAENGLVERLAQEGRNSPADLLLSADAGRLVEAANRGLAQPVTSPAILDKIPANLRDDANQWFGLTMRARVIYASNERAPITAITYEELADPKWKGKLCMRPGNHPYNIALFAAMIAHKGEDATREWLKGVKANLAFKPNGNDRAQAKSVFAGECDLALANTYYMGKMLTNNEEPEQKKWAGAVKIVFPSSPQFGTHVNISGMMLTANAPNKDNALKLMEFLAGDEAQMLYAQGNYEYPVNPAVGVDPIVKSWGSFTPDKLNVADVAKHEAAAAKLIDEVGFND